MQGIKLALVAALAAVSMGGAQAQQAYVTVTAELNPNEVTLSRDGFTSRAAWRFLVRNGGGGGLNTDTLVVRTSAGTFDPTFPIIPIAPSKLATCTPNATAKELRCTFSTTGTYVGETSEFIVVVIAPTALPTTGNSITLSWSRANSGFVDVLPGTLLIDGTTDASVKTHVQSFMLASANNKAFTGTTGGLATLADPWTTFANLGQSFKVGGKDQIYTKITVDEDLNLNSCSALNKNQCWVSQVTIPDTTWPVTSPLLIELSRHSSIIKNGSKLSNYLIGYSKSGVPPFNQLPSCSVTPPAEGAPCVDYCEEIPLATSPPTFVWKCYIKALDNGKYTGL